MSNKTINYLINADEFSLEFLVFNKQEMCFNLGLFIRCLINSGRNVTNLQELTDYVEETILPEISEALDRKIEFNAIIRDFTNEEKKLVLSIIGKYLDPKAITVYCMPWPIPKSEQVKSDVRKVNDELIYKALGILLGDHTLEPQQDCSLLKYNGTFLAVLYAFHSIQNSTPVNKQEEDFNVCFIYHKHRFDMLEDRALIVTIIHRELSGMVKMEHGEDCRIFYTDADILDFLRRVF